MTQSSGPWVQHGSNAAARGPVLGTGTANKLGTHPDRGVKGRGFCTMTFSIKLVNVNCY